MNRNKEIETKETRFFFKDNEKRIMAKCFLKITLEKNKSIAKMVKIKKIMGFFQKDIIFATFVQQNDNFLRDPKRRLTQENQEKEYHETPKTSKTWKRQGIRTTQ